jgi:hypothetical protein
MANIFFVSVEAEAVRGYAYVACGLIAQKGKCRIGTEE